MKRTLVRKNLCNKHVIDFSGFDPSLAAFKMDFKETQSSVDRKQQTNYDDEVGQCLDKEVKSDKNDFTMVRSIL